MKKTKLTGEVLQGLTDLEKLKAMKKNDTVILLGTAGTMNITPWDQQDTDYWACSPAMTYEVTVSPDGKPKHKIDLVFEMHKPEYYLGIAERLNNHGCPIVMCQEVQQIPKSLKYPLEDVQGMINNEKGKVFFTSTIAYMLGLAIKLEYKFVEFYGVHMGAQEEQYSIQRNSLEHLLGIADAKGIAYWMPPESDIMKCQYLYGYEQQKDTLLKLMNRKEMMLNGLTEIKKKFEDLKIEMYQQEGAVKDLEQLINVFR